MPLLSACGAQNSERVSGITVTGNGTDKEGAFCQSFNLTSAQAKDFFQLATPVTSREIHNKYEYLECYVQGKGLYQGEECSWQIRAGGTASVDCPTKGNHLFGCLSCEHLLVSEAAGPT
jgi:hypothetical protein